MDPVSIPQVTHSRRPGPRTPPQVHDGDVLLLDGMEATVREITTSPEPPLPVERHVIDAVAGRVEIVAPRGEDDLIPVVTLACPHWRCRCGAHAKAPSWRLAEQDKAAHVLRWHRSTQGVAA
ncbi:MAG: hypothetical protein J2P19_32810 [Pseudonocardia sp.]|nr:hypothetical protein [Pseudonocardia sp.]